MSTVPTSWMSRAKVVETPTGTDWTNVLAIEICMLLVSVGDGDGSGGEGVGTTAAGLLPQATTRRPTAIAATMDLSILKFGTPVMERVERTRGLYRLVHPESSHYPAMRWNSSAPIEVTQPGIDKRWRASRLGFAAVRPLEVLGK